MNPKITRVILVEDHDLFRTYLKKYIEQVAGCQIVAEAANGEEALAAIYSTPADLIVLDWRLPNRTGLSVLQNAKKISSAKVLVVTMHTEQEIIQEALTAGADGVCLKDMGIRVLEKSILDTMAGKKPVSL